MAEGFEPLRTEEDVEEILRLAIRQGVHGSGSLRERLTMSASDLGITDEALRLAEQQWLSKRKSEHDIEVEKTDRALFRKIQIGDFVQHLAAYVAVNGFLVWLDVFRDNRLDWAYWPIAGWGIAIVIHAVSAFTTSAEHERDFERWRKKRSKKRE